MPKFYTKAFEGKTLYFDFRTGGVGEPEGVHARPIFASKEIELERKCLREGRQEQLWIELLVYSLEGWEGFYDVAGGSIPFSGENVRQLCESDHSFMRTVLHVIRSANHATLEDAEKN
ncbi:MAG: hypothetical protein LBV80_10950 [Deltaproteobacteria bacterium]|jgi:hypothetical protein|nr:hypothetical protein [Deltaproteobacteria bacterium]